MSPFTIMILILSVVVAAGLLAYYFQSGVDEELGEEQPTFESYTQEELENIKLAEELYNKTTQEVTEQPAMAVVVEDLTINEPEFIAKTTTEPAPIEEPKPEPSVDKPKKKRKYYPKKKKS